MVEEKLQAAISEDLSLDKPDFRNYILVVYPELILKYKGQEIFRRFLIAHDIIYLCENGGEAMTEDII